MPGAVDGSGRSIGDPYIPYLGNTGYDVQSYLLQLSLNPKVSEVISTVTIEALATAENLMQVSLDFVGYEIIQVTVASELASFTREAGKLVVNLPRPVGSGSLFTLNVTYRGEPTKEASPYVGFTDALGLSHIGTEGIYTLSEPDGARYWFPCNDHPRDKAIFRFEVTVPVGQTAVANGRLVDIRMADLETLPGGGTGRTFVWEHHHPMATYLALVAVGRFQRIESVSPDGVILRHYVTAEFREELISAVSIVGEAIDWMSDLFGPYPFEAFGYVAAELPPTALETQTMVLLSNEVIGQKTAIHELAHMWFGDWVSPDSWSEVWRKEGFATYITLMWETRSDPETLDQEIENIMAAVAQNTPQYAIGNPPPQHLLGYNTYFKGAAFIHALRQQMGDAAFFDGVQAYLLRFGGSSASDAQFQAVMEEAAGFSLDALFNDWLN
jgi:aminopeptidase N